MTAAARYCTADSTYQTPRHEWFARRVRTCPMPPPARDASAAELLRAAIERLERVEGIVRMLRNNAKALPNALATDASDWLDEIGQCLVALGHDVRNREVA